MPDADRDFEREESPSACVNSSKDEAASSVFDGGMWILLIPSENGFQGLRYKWQRMLRCWVLAAGYRWRFFFFCLRCFDVRLAVCSFILLQKYTIARAPLDIQVLVAYYGTNGAWSCTTQNDIGTWTNMMILKMTSSFFTSRIESRE